MKTILIFEAGLQEAREYWLNELKKLGYSLVLAQPWPITWEEKYVKSYYQFEFKNWSYEKNNLLNFCIKEKVSGILALNEGTIPFANELINNLGLPKLTNNSIEILRNKYSMREHVKKESKLKQPKYKKISINEMIPENYIVFPAVVKPVELMSSLGVKLVKNQHELSTAINDARIADFENENLRNHYNLSNDILIEEYIDGKEFSIESIVQNGKVLHQDITQKIKTPLPYFYEIGHLTNPNVDRDLMSDIYNYVIVLHDHLGVLNAVTHTEIKIQNSDIYLIEIACRPGGDMIPMAQTYSSGLNYIEKAANICTGENIENNLNKYNKTTRVGIFFPTNLASANRVIEIVKSSENKLKILNLQFYKNIWNTEDSSSGLDRVGQFVFSFESDDFTEQTIIKLADGNYEP